MVPQLTLAVHNEDAFVDMRFEKLNKEIADSRIEWYSSSTKLSDTRFVEDLVVKVEIERERAREG